MRNASAANVSGVSHSKPFFLRSALSKYVPYIGALLCVSGRDRFSSSSFQSTRRSTLTSQSESKGAARARNSSASDSESVSVCVLGLSPFHFLPQRPNLRHHRSALTAGSLLGHGGGILLPLADRPPGIHRRQTGSPRQPEVKGQSSQHEV